MSLDDPLTIISLIRIKTVRILVNIAKKKKLFKTKVRQCPVLLPKNVFTIIVETFKILRKILQK